MTFKEWHEAYRKASQARQDYNDQVKPRGNELLREQNRIGDLTQRIISYDGKTWEFFWRDPGLSIYAKHDGYQFNVIDWKAKHYAFVTYVMEIYERWFHDETSGIPDGDYIIKAFLGGRSAKEVK